MSLKDVRGGQSKLLYGCQTASIVCGHVIACDSCKSIALRLAKQAAQQMGTIVDPGFHVSATNQGGVMGQQGVAHQRVVVSQQLDGEKSQLAADVQG